MRWQFVWWGRRADWQWGMYRWRDSGMGLIYDLSILMGPIELRRWAKRT